MLQTKRIALRVGSSLLLLVFLGSMVVKAQYRAPQVYNPWHYHHTRTQLSRRAAAKRAVERRRAVEKRKARERKRRGGRRASGGRS